MKFYLSLLFVLLSASHSFSNTIADTPIINLYYNGPFTLRGNKATDTINIPFKLADETIPITAITIQNQRPLFVRSGQLYQHAFQEAFTITIDVASSSIQIIADLTRLDAPLTFELLLTLSANGKKQQLDAISIVRPAASLYVDRVIKIKVEGSDVTGSPFVLKEKGRIAGIHQLLLNEPVMDSSMTGGVIHFPVKAISLGAGQSVQVQYDINHKELRQLPLGPSHGYLELSSAEMPTPLVVEFEVTRTRSKSLIYILIFLGIATGFFYRGYIKRRIELSEKRILGADLLLTISNEVKPIQDVAYLNAVQVCIAPLEILLKKESSFFPAKESLSASLSAATIAVTDNYNTGKTKFKTDFDTIQKEVKAFGDVITNQHITPAIKQYLTSTDNHYTAAVAALTVYDITTATADRNKAFLQLQQFLAVYVKSINDFYALHQQQLVIPAILPATSVTDLVTLIDKLHTEAAAIATAPADTAAADVAFKQVLNFEATRNQLLTVLQQRVTTLYLHDYNPVDTSLTMTTFKLAFGKWTAGVDQLITSPLLTFPNNLVPDLNQAWASITAARQAAGTRLAGEGLQQLAQTPPISWQERQLDSNGHYFAGTTFFADPIEKILQRAKANYLGWTLIKSLVLLLLLSATGYNVYAPGFVGTYGELLAIFIAAFSLDITVDTVFTFPPKV